MTDPVAAALACRPLILRMEARSYPAGTGPEHLLWMVEQVEAGARGNMCREKAMRWLGWIQAAVAGGGATLEEMREMNR